MSKQEIIPADAVERVRRTIKQLGLTNAPRWAEEYLVAGALGVEWKPDKRGNDEERMMALHDETMEKLRDWVEGDDPVYCRRCGERLYALAYRVQSETHPQRHGLYCHGCSPHGVTMQAVSL